VYRIEEIRTDVGFPPPFFFSPLPRPNTKARPGSLPFLSLAPLTNRESCRFFLFPPSSEIAANGFFFSSRERGPLRTGRGLAFFPLPPPSSQLELVAAAPLPSSKRRILEIFFSLRVLDTDSRSVSSSARLPIKMGTGPPSSGGGAQRTVHIFSPLPRIDGSPRQRDRRTAPPLSFFLSPFLSGLGLGDVEPTPTLSSQTSAFVVD